MRLLQFSTSPFCRKARLALGYKQIPYQIENLSIGVHRFKLTPLTGLTTVPVLLPEHDGQPQAIGDSTRILQFLETYQPEPSFLPKDPAQQTTAWMLEDWFDESIGIATRFVYYHYRAGEGKAIDPSPASQLVIRIVRWQYGINPAAVELARQRLALALQIMQPQWETGGYLVGDRLSVADLAAAGLLSPLALIPSYRDHYPWLFDRIAAIHQQCQEALPPGLASDQFA